MSWLRFNDRVLGEAQRLSHPLLERVRFLAISSSNLQEFMMVRLAGLLGQIEEGVSDLGLDGRSPLQQFEMVNDKLTQVVNRQQDIWAALKKELKEQNIRLRRLKTLDEKDLEWLENYTQQELLPVLSPITVDPTHPFPFVRNLGRAIVVKLKREKDNRHFTGLIVLPANLPKLLILPRRKSDKGEPGDQGQVRVLPVFEALRHALPQMFPDLKIEGYSEFQVVRDSELELAEEAEDLVRSFESALRRRQRGSVIRLIVHKSISASLLDFLCEELEIDPEGGGVAKVAGLIDLTDLDALTKLDRPDLLFPPFRARFPERIRDFEGDCFAAIAAKDFVVHHPFESFDVVVQFLQQAARDPNVLAIKQTLYRTSDDSPIISALCDASEQGKAVTAVVELKARFDEAANIRWARRLEAAGVQVAYGFMDLKTHAKVSMVTRREADKTVTYTHFGTGNYHPQTAKIYTDLSYFSAKTSLAQDAAKLFNFMTAYAQPRGLNQVYAAPHNLRERIMEGIERETRAAQEGRTSGIWFKMNSLVDPQVISALYQASAAGVPIELVIRGICCLKVGLLGQSETIRVRSLVGRFLEHSRIYCFANGAPLPSRQAEVYMSSADLMPRNLDRRVEAMVQITNETVHAQILDQIMVANLSDIAGSWIMDEHGDYRPLRPLDLLPPTTSGAEPASASSDDSTPEDANPQGAPAPQSIAFSAHDFFMNNPSLSGQGSAQVRTPALRFGQDVPPSVESG